ncbi:hypothetical protein C8R45DRAFT_1070238 [Mycena sanguinolenta]|nr:hypothetical protein C8R45DRAFT_1070238 [Mycena sanguinolenta]
MHKEDRKAAFVPLKTFVSRGAAMPHGCVKRISDWMPSTFALYGYVFDIGSSQVPVRGQRRRSRCGAADCEVLSTIHASAYPPLQTHTTLYAHLSLGLSGQHALLLRQPRSRRPDDPRRAPRSMAWSNARPPSPRIRRPRYVLYVHRSLGGTHPSRFPLAHTASTVPRKRTPSWLMASWCSLLVRFGGSCWLRVQLLRCRRFYATPSVFRDDDEQARRSQRITLAEVVTLFHGAHRNARESASPLITSGPHHLRRPSSPLPPTRPHPPRHYHSPHPQPLPPTSTCHCRAPAAASQRDTHAPPSCHEPAPYTHALTETAHAPAHRGGHGASVYAALNVVQCLLRVWRYTHTFAGGTSIPGAAIAASRRRRRDDDRTTIGKPRPPDVRPDEDDQSRGRGAARDGGEAKARYDEHDERRRTRWAGGTAGSRQPLLAPAKREGKDDAQACGALGTMRGARGGGLCVWDEHEREIGNGGVGEGVAPRAAGGGGVRLRSVELRLHVHLRDHHDSSSAATAFPSLLSLALALPTTMTSKRSDSAMHAATTPLRSAKRACLLTGWVVGEAKERTGVEAEAEARLVRALSLAGSGSGGVEGRLGLEGLRRPQREPRRARFWILSRERKLQW